MPQLRGELPRAADLQGPGEDVRDSLAQQGSRALCKFCKHAQRRLCLLLVALAGHDCLRNLHTSTAGDQWCAPGLLLNLMQCHQSILNAQAASDAQ